MRHGAALNEATVTRFTLKQFQTRQLGGHKFKQERVHKVICERMLREKERFSVKKDVFLQILFDWNGI